MVTPTHYIVRGKVKPLHPGLDVTVTLLRGSRGREWAKRTPTMNDEGVFRTRIARPKLGTCRITVVFDGDRDHRPSRGILSYFPC